VILYIYRVARSYPTWRLYTHEFHTNIQVLLIGQTGLADMQTWLSRFAQETYIKANSGRHR